MTPRQYVIVIEGGDRTNFSAYAPDLPGCVATGETAQECEAEMRDAISFHIEGLIAEGFAVPEPTAVTAAVVHLA